MKDASRRFYSPQAQVKKQNVVITSQYLQTKNKGNTGKKKEIVTETEEIHVSIV